MQKKRGRTDRWTDVMTGRNTKKSRNKRGFDKYEMVTITAGRKEKKCGINPGSL